MADEATPQGEEIDPNTEAGFYASIAKSAGIELDPAKLQGIAEDDRSISSGLTYPESTPQPRDDSGRFARTEVTEPAAPVVPATEEGAAPSGGEDPLAALLEQHGGDANAALAAVFSDKTNLESVLGRQGDELGRLRPLEEKIANLEGQITALTATAPAAPAAPETFVSEAQIREAITSGEDPSETAVGVMDWVIKNAPDMIEETERIWAEFDPYAALAFRQDRIQFEAEKERQGASPTPTAASDEVTTWVQEQRTKETVNTALTAAFKDVPEADREALKPLVLAELQSAPQYEKDAINKGDLATKVAAFTNIVTRAQSKVVREATATVAEQAAAEALAGKEKATVLHGGQQPPATPESEERTPEMVSKLLRDALLATETTSVADGLTYGNPQPGLAGQVR